MCIRKLSILAKTLKKGHPIGCPFFGFFAGITVRFSIVDSQLISTQESAVLFALGLHDLDFAVAGDDDLRIGFKVERSAAAPIGVL